MTVKDPALPLVHVEPIQHAWAHDFELFVSEEYIVHAEWCGSSGFVAKINGAPSGKNVVYDTVTGNEKSIKPASGGNIAPRILHNTTRGNSGLIDAVNTTTKTITLVDDVPANWADNDDIQVNSLTALMTETPFYYDVDCSAFLPANCVGALLDICVLDDTAVNEVVRLHPYEAVGVRKHAKSQVCRTQAVNTYNYRSMIVKIVDQKFCILWEASGADTMIVVIRCFGFWRK